MNPLRRIRDNLILYWAVLALCTASFIAGFAIAEQLAIGMIKEWRR